MSIKSLGILLLILCSIGNLSAQNDSIRFSKDQYLKGEIKKLDKGVLTVSTSYSDSDFKIEWEKVTYISSKVHFLVSTSDGRRFEGYLKTLSNGKIQVRTSEDEVYSYTKAQIIYLNTLKDRFLDQAYASFDIGLNITKSNNYRQLSFNSNMGYLGKKWSTDISYSGLNSIQDNAADISRQNGSLSLRYYLPRDYFIVGSLSTLSNTEQNLDFRLNSSAGIGKFIIHTNHTYWAFQIGTNSNREMYYNDSSPSNSWEGYAGSTLNLFDVGNISLNTTLQTYYSRESLPRWRIDYSLTTKYDLPLDFYINLDLNLNYDSRPSDGSKSDYVLTTGFGWEL
ncbi:MAG: DUF481 domain-containing protein [Flavobacteriaceae bacterium]